MVVVVALFSVAVTGFDLEFEVHAQTSPNLISLHPDHERPAGILFHDDKFWVTDQVPNRVFVYDSNSDDGKYEYDADSVFTLSAENSSPRGITFHDDKFWVVDGSFMVFAYDSDGTPNKESGFALPRNDSYQGITFHDSKFWITGTQGTGKLYSCSLDNEGACNIESTFELDSRNMTPTGVVFDGEYFWIVDTSIGAIFAYDGLVAVDRDFKDTINQKLEINTRGVTAGLAFHDSKLWSVDLVNPIVKSFKPPVIDVPTPKKLNTGNLSPLGMTFYDDKLWVTDLTEKRVYVYGLDPDETNTNKFVHTLEDEFTVDVADGAFLSGIEFANDRFWLVEAAPASASNILAYDMDGNPDEESNISTIPRTIPVSLVAHNDKLWVTDLTPGVNAYNLDGTPDAESGFALHADNTYPRGITVHDDTFYILDQPSKRIFAYALDDGGKYTYDESSSFKLHTTNNFPNGIAFYDDKFWIADADPGADADNKKAKHQVFAYDNNGELIPGLGFLLDNGNTNPTGMVFADDKFWLVEHDDRRIYDYTQNDDRGMYDYTEDWEHDPFSEFILHDMNQFPAGVTFDGTNLWVVNNETDFEMIFSYTLDGESAGEPIRLHNDNSRPSGVTFDGTKLWVTDEHDDILYGYDLNGEFYGTIPILADTDEPSGIIFVDNKFWVIDGGNNNVVVYDTDGNQVVSSGFVLDDENNSPRGISFVDGVFWVADKNGTAYPYTMELNIGLVLSVGDVDWLNPGEETKIAADLAIVEFNDYLSGMDSVWRLNVDFRDTDLDTEKALEEVTALNDGGIDVIVGVPTSASVTAVKDYINDNDMVLVSCCSSAPQLAVEDNVFRMVPPDSGQAPLLAKHIMDAEISDVLVIYRDDAWGVGLKDVFKSSFEELDGTILYDTEYDPNDSTHADFDGIASITSDMISEHENPDNVGVVFLGWSETATMMGVATNYSNLSDVVWFGSGDSAGEPTILEEPAVSFAMDTSFSVVQFIPERNDITEKVKAHVMNETGRDPAVYAYSTYDAVWVAGMAMLEADSNDGADVISQIHTAAANRTGAMGNNALTPAGDLALSNYTVQAVRDGMWKDLGPVNTATITGTIFSDVNKNGIMDADESGIENYEMVTINLTNPSDIMKTTTNSDGMYEFAVEPSNVILVQAGYFPPNTTVSDVNTSWYKYVTLQAGDIGTFDIGFIPISTEEHVTLNLVMYIDENLNGMMDADENTVSGLDDFYVFTYTIGPVAYPVPDEMGRASVTNLVPSDFAVFVHVDLLAEAGYVWATTSYSLHGDDAMEYILTAPAIRAPEPGSEYTMMVGLLPR